MRRRDIEVGVHRDQMMGLPEKPYGGEFQMGRMDAQSLVIFLVIGLVAGFLASLIVGGGRLGVIGYLISGVIGSFVGGYLFTALNINLGGKSPILSQIITSTVGAIIVVIIARLIG